jgi:hypothetical protein
VEYVGIFYRHLVFLMAFGVHILWSFGVFCGHLVYYMVPIFFRFSMLYQEKSGNPEEDYIADG